MTEIIYVASPESQQIYVWKLDKQNKKLHLIQVIFTPGPGQPIAIHPSKKFLYIGTRPDFKIITYSINRLGFLKDIGNTKIFSSPTYLAVNIQGTFLYCASYQYNTVSVYPLYMSGIVGSSTQIIEDLLGCHAIGIDHKHNVLWVPCLKDNAIRLFTINMFGMLVQSNILIMQNNIVVGPRHIVFHSTDYYAYVINELNSTINVINYDYSLKILNIVQTLDIIPEKFMHVIPRYWGSDIHIVPKRNWLYCTDRATNIITCFKISCKTKQLKFISCQSTETQPRGFAINSTGQFLVVAGQKSHHISLYYININDGKLTILSRYYSGKGPMWISIVALD